MTQSNINSSESGLTLSNKDPVNHGRYASQIDSQRRTNYLFILLLICSFLAATLAIGILVVSTLSSMLNLPSADYLPFMDSLALDRQMFTTVAVLLLIALSLVILARWRLIHDQSYQFVNGCPSCSRHDLIRIHRSQYQRLFAKFLRGELRSYACRNCQWRGSLVFSL